MLPTRDPHQNKRPTQTESEELEKNIPSKWVGEKSWCSITYIRQNRLHKKKAIIMVTEGHFIIHKGRIHEEDINIVNIYASKYIRKILEDFKKDRDSNTRMLKDFNTLQSKMDRSSQQNINKDIAALNNALDQMDLTDIYRNFHPKETKYTLFSNVQGTLSKIDHMIGHKISLKKIQEH